MSARNEPFFFDVGNTYVHWRWKDRLGSFPSTGAPLVVPADLHEILALIDEIVVVSVRKASLQSELLHLAPQAQWHYAKEFPRTVLNSGYDTQRLGTDRWVGMLGAVALGLTDDDQPVCVVDAGTAVTFDALHGRQHLGGWIMPGYRVWFESLLQQTDMALARPDSPARALGVSTNSAVANAWVVAVSAMIAMLKAEHPGLRVLLTGGDAQRLGPWVPDALHIPDLIFQGLGFWYQHCKATL